MMKRSILALTLTTLLTAPLALSSVARILAFTTTLLSATLALNSVARADQQADWQEIVNRYQAQTDVMVEKTPFDINQIFASYAPNWTLIDTNGKVYSLEDARLAMHNFREARGYVMRRTLKDLSPVSDGQTFKVRYNERDVVKYYFTNQDMDMFYVLVTAIEQVEDTWANTPGGWRLVRTHVLERNTSQDQPQAIDPHLNDMSKLMNLNMRGQVLKDWALQNWALP